ncbi:MAG TPA: endonuclease domain-containing protein [Methylovirgula sp.]
MRGIRLIETRRARALRREATKAETILWQKLKGRSLAGLKFVRQEPIGPYIADLVCREKKLIIEIDGATHSSDDEMASDIRRTNVLEKHGFRVVRFTNEAVFESADGVLQMILAELQSD